MQEDQSSLQPGLILRSRSWRGTRWPLRPTRRKRRHNQENRRPGRHDHRLGPLAPGRAAFALFAVLCFSVLNFKTMLGEVLAVVRCEVVLPVPSFRVGDRSVGFSDDRLSMSWILWR